MNEATNYAWTFLKNDGSFYMDDDGAPLKEQNMQQSVDRLNNTQTTGGQPQQSQSPNSPTPPEQEESKPLYDQKQQLATAHFLMDDVNSIAQKLMNAQHAMGTIQDQGGDWERLMYDIQRIKQILEEALTGDGARPSGGL
tara:strand:+ start:1607 stop:2026 length:420 start_codon:yes stop_codon:yes gene_type:complete